MQALLFADRPGKALLPLARRNCAALLVVAKPLVVFAVEDLPSPASAKPWSSFPRTPIWWSMNPATARDGGCGLDYLLARPDESLERVVRKVIGQLGEQLRRVPLQNNRTA